MKDGGNFWNIMIFLGYELLHNGIYVMKIDLDLYFVDSFYTKAFD